MKRRSVVKDLMIASGGLIVLPFWMQACHPTDKNTHESSFSEEQQGILAKIADAIIPAGASIGALSMGVDKFLQKLIDDCYEKTVQDNVKKQLLALETMGKDSYGNPFTDCSLQQRQALLMKWQHSQQKEEKDFFDLVKSETIRGFNTSQKVMEEYYHYKVAPGHYYGCINVKA
jgi:hypothetical protein